METYVKKIGGEWKVGFSQGCQFFTLEGGRDEKEEAEWMKSMLDKAFANMIKEELDSEGSYIPANTLDVSVHLLSQSQPMEYHEVKNAYTKDGLYCLYLDDGTVDKFPLVNIFRIKETYK